MCRNATKDTQYCLVVELVFPDNPDGDLRLMKKVRLTTFTVNKT